MLLGMVMNVGRQVDGKIRLQNAADAAAYSGGLVLARGMNSLAFSNHLLSEVFAMTAFLREARDNRAKNYVPEILAAWRNVATVFQRAGFAKFRRLGEAIPEKTRAEQRLVDAFSNWVEALAGNGRDGGALWQMETILAGQAIPNYQRLLIQNLPETARRAANAAAAQNGLPDYGRGPMAGALWQAETASPLADNFLALLIDPNASNAIEARNQKAGEYLGMWNQWVLRDFDRFARMSQFAVLWRGFSCGRLQQLESEYADSNYPILFDSSIQVDFGFVPDPYKKAEEYEEALDRHFAFVGAAYWGRVPATGFPWLFRNPIESDALAFAQVRVFVPANRLVWVADPPSPMPMSPSGGTPGYARPGDDGSGGAVAWRPDRQPGVSTTWDLWNQHWTCQLVPARHRNIREILEKTPPGLDLNGRAFAPPNLTGVTTQDMERISFH